jgi:hypothetical protein
MTPFINSNLTVEHCLHANNVVYNTICDKLRKEEVDNDNEVTYHAASIQLMQTARTVLARWVVGRPCQVLCQLRDMRWNRCIQEGEGSSNTCFPE